MTRWEDSAAAASWSEHVRWGQTLRKYQEKRDAERAASSGVVESGSRLSAIPVVGTPRRPKAQRRRR